MKLSVDERNRPDANWSGRGGVGGRQNYFFKSQVLLGGAFGWWTWDVSE